MRFLIKIFFCALLFAPLSGFALCNPSGGSGYVNITPVPADPWGNGGARKYYCIVPPGFPSDGTGVIIFTLNGSTLASVNIGQAMATGTTGLWYKCALMSPKCAVIGPEPLTASRYHIEKINCCPTCGTGAAAGCAINSRELNPSGGGNTTVANLAGACSSVNSNTATTATFVDSQTVTILKAATTCTETNPSAFAEIGSQNGSFASLMRAEPSDSVDDIGFITQILKAEIPNLNIDKTKIYCVGWSAGAFECAYLASQRPDMFAAIGLAEGSIGSQHYRSYANIDLETEFPTGGVPISVLAFCGTTDATVPCSGGMAPTFYQQNISQTLQHFLAQNNITSFGALPVTTGTRTVGATITCVAGTSYKITLPSAPAGLGYGSSPPNNTARLSAFSDNVNFPGIPGKGNQIDILIAGIAGNDVSSTTLTAASGYNNGTATCTAAATGTVTIEPKPYVKTADTQFHFLATGGVDGTAVEEYTLNGSGHTYWGGYSDPGVTYTVSAGGSTITRSSGAFSVSATNDGFTVGEIIGLPSSSGWVANANITCTVTGATALVLTVGSCSSALTNETPSVGAYVTDNVINGKNSNIAAACVNQTDVLMSFFYAHPKPTWWNTRGIRMENSRF